MVVLGAQSSSMTTPSNALKMKTCGSMPQGWKHARVTPLLKEECLPIWTIIDLDLSCPWHQNYWSWLFTIQLYSFCNEHKLSSRFQRGFRANHSTEFAAVAFPDFVRRGMNQGLLIGAVLLTCVRRLILSTTID